MPTTESILWAAIAGLIVLMLGIIGYLLKSGFDGIKAEFRLLWERLDKHQSLNEHNALRIAALESRCEERHKL